MKIVDVSRHPPRVRLHPSYYLCLRLKAPAALFYALAMIELSMKIEKITLSERWSLMAGLEFSI
jgi:hypothetical protein